MSTLASFQDALGRLMLALDDGAQACAEPLAQTAPGAPAGDRDLLERIAHGPGFRFTRGVQRSWCEARVARTAALTLAVLPASRREALLSIWLQRGGGRRSFSAEEGMAFLEFVAATLEPGTHAASLCRFEWAVHAAAAADAAAADAAASSDAAASTEPLADAPADDALVLSAPGATLVHFHAPPAELLEAARSGQALPPVQPANWYLLIAPGVPGLVHVPDADQTALLAHETFPQRRSALRARGHAQSVIDGLVVLGALAFRGYEGYC